MRYPAWVRIDRIRWSWLLPAIEIAGWVLLAPLPAAVMVYRFHSVAHGAEALSLHWGQVEMILPRGRWFPFALESVALKRSQVLSAANLPGAFGAALIPKSWRVGIPLDSWRAISFPFFCLPAWWLVGCGIDALAGRRRPHRAMLVTGSVLCLLCLFLLVGIALSSPSERADMDWVSWGLGFWALAFGALPANWLRDRRSLRRKPV
jgi:hypothetical protein